MSARLEVPSAPPIPAAADIAADDERRIREIMPRVVAAYHSPLERAYCRVRFIILRERFTREIAQYLPAEGRILELGCGFGLFTLLFAHLRPGATFTACDLNPRRIEMARRAAKLLGITNALFFCRDVADLDLSAGGTHAEDHEIAAGPFQAGYMMDLVHHLSPNDGRALIGRIHASMDAGSVFVLKDVDSRPVLKRLFTRTLDFLVSPRDAVRYWPEAEMRETLTRAGWRVASHAMVDFLPYPHQIYICRKATKESLTSVGF